MLTAGHPRPRAGRHGRPADAEPVPGRSARRWWAAPVALLGALAAATPARAQAPVQEPVQAVEEEQETGCAEGRRIAAGICFDGELSADGFANLRGGVRRGVRGFGHAALGLGVDFGQAAGLEGWSFQATAFGILGRQPTLDLVGSLAPASSTEALSAFRLSELWLQREARGLGSLRVGQLAVDAEFATAEAAGKLVNATFGWPVGLATALPSGGPAYPFAAPGVRLALGDPDDGAGLRLALFSGDPGGRRGAETDPQRHNRFGTNFSFAGGAFLIAEAVFGAAAPAPDAPRPWVGKLGAWRHTGGVDAQLRDARGRSLVDPDSTGAPRRFGSNHGGYAIGEATLWRAEGSSVAAFARVFGAPDDRNLVSLQLDAGLMWRGPFGRAGDALSLGASYARVGAAARRLDRDRRTLLGEERRIRDRELVIEANYEFEAVLGRFYVRPLAQWIISPAAREPDERTGSERPLRDAFLVGLRLRLVF